MWYLLRLLLIGPSRFSPKETRLHTPQSGREPFDVVDSGMMRIRFWKNLDSRGRTYFNLDLVRVVGRNELSKHFKGSDLDDIKFVARKAQAWLRENVADLDLRKY